MSPERLVERCALEFERYVAKLHREVGRVRASIPIAPYEMEYTRSNIPKLIRMARTAFQARAAFALEGPSWAQPLPLGIEGAAFTGATGAMHVLGCYAFSLELMSHDYLGHPRFHDFACGMMAHTSAPEHVRNDLELQVEFPARELPGLDGRMLWFGERLSPAERLQALGDKRLLA